MAKSLVVSDAYASLKQDMARVMATDSGRNLLRYILQETGFQAPSLAILGNQVDFHATLVNEGRRGIWLPIRKLIAPEQLALIENFNPPPEARTQDTTPRKRGPETNEQPESDTTD